MSFPPLAARRGVAWTAACCGLLLVAGMAGGGCTTARPSDPKRFACVTIADHTAAEVREATRAVFERHGYRTVLPGETVMVFEKPAGTGDLLLHGGWSRRGTALRAKVWLSVAGPTSYSLAVQAFVVRDAGDPAIEDERALGWTRRGAFQALLEEVREELGAPAGVGD